MASGIVHNKPNGSVDYLPLEEVRIHAFVVDVSARVTLRQAFSNPSDLPTPRAKYVFPVPARASVCAFEMNFEDGRKIIGVAKEASLAAQEHKTAVAQGKASGLVEWATDDLFTISVGSIPARQVVTTKLVFVMDLIDDEFINDVRLYLPVAMGERYGPPVDAIAAAASAEAQTRLRISVDIQMSGALESVHSPTHSIQTTPYITSAGLPSRRRATVTHRSPTFQQSDFVLVLRASGLDEPRCFAERDERDPGTYALQLTLIPKIKLPPVAEQEYLFIIDRSGSMNGPPMETAKRTLSMLLRMLPNKNTKFNIFSFGDHADGIWPASRIYSEQTLAEASDEVAEMQANYGGTEMRAALEFSLQKRDFSMATAAFVLTDGEITAVEETLDVVRNIVASSAPTAPFRLFTLGIGTQVSTDVVEGLARVGNGEALFAVKAESIVGKCARLLRAGRSHIVENVTVDWGVSRSPDPSTVAFDSSTAGSLFPRIQQSPPTIKKIFPGMRLIVFAICRGKVAPKEVVLRGKLGDNQDDYSIIVPVSSVRPFDKKQPGILMLHALAARRLVTDVLDNNVLLPASTLLGNLSKPDLTKALVVYLGEKYQIVTRHTSFVAGDLGEDDRAALRRRRSQAQGGSMRKDDHDRSSRDMMMDDWSETDAEDGYMGLALAYGLNLTSAAFSLFLGGPTSAQNTTTSTRTRERDESTRRERGRARQRPTSNHLPGYFSPSSSPSATDRDRDDNDENASDSADSFSTISSLEDEESVYSTESSRSSSPERRPPPQPAPTAEELAQQRSPSPVLPSNNEIDPRERARRRRGGITHSPPIPALNQQIVSIVQLQSFDGSFKPTSELFNALGVRSLSKPADVIGDDTVWTTALAVAALEESLRLDGHTDLLETLLDKITEYIHTTAVTDEEFDLLVSRAQDVLAKYRLVS